MPLREVREVLATPDSDARASLVAAHLSRLESELDKTRMAVTSLRRLLQPEPERFDVELRLVPPMTVAAIGEAVDQARVLGWYDAAMTELDTALAGRQVRQRTVHRRLRGRAGLPSGRGAARRRPGAPRTDGTARSPAHSCGAAPC